MGKKRKSVASTRLDEVDRNLYTSFCTAANSLSQLYTQSINHQRLSFQAGERHSLEKLFHWILRQQEDGARVPTMDIVSYLQVMHQCPLGCLFSIRILKPPCICLLHAAPFLLVNLVRQLQDKDSVPSIRISTVGKDAVFSDALSSLQHCHLTQGGYHTNSNMSALPSPSSNRRNNNEGLNPHHPTREANPTSSNDTSMDMNADGSLY